jgi:tripartite-type tricarboxylate transporter receptor subunit TctC
MKLPRRQFLHLAAGAVAMPFVSRTGWAQGYPNRPIRLIVGFIPGGAVDTASRIIGPALSDRFGQSVIVENRPGGGSNLAAQAVINSPPDGYTLLAASGSNAVNATFYASLPFNFLRDIEPVAGVVSYPLVLVVNESLPAKTLPEFLSLARTSPSRITMASFGVGTSGHLSWELLRMMTNINLVHVPYRGEGPALTDVVGGQVQAMFSSPVGALQHTKANKIRAIAVTFAKRWEILPDVPPIAEVVPNYEAGSWTGIGGPRGTPKEIIAILNREISNVLAEPAIKARLVQSGMTPMTLTPAEFGAFLTAETEKWGKVVRASGAKPE